MDALTLTRYELPIATPLKVRRGLLVRIGDRWGDIAPLPGWSSETLEEAEEQVKQVIKGEKPLLYPSVAFGLESVLSDYQAPQVTLPLSALLMGSAEEIVAKAKKCANAGFKSAKLKVSQLPFEEAIEIAMALKEHFALRIDVNRAWSLEKALRFFSCFGYDDFDYVEEPLDNPDDLVHFTHPFALDESLAEKYLDLPHLKALVLKPTFLGTACHKFIRLAKARDLQIVFSSAFESGVGIYQIAAMALREKVLLHPLGLDTYSFLEKDLLEMPFDFSKGAWTLPTSINPRL